jgi:hypothetical protein
MSQKGLGGQRLVALEPDIRESGIGPAIIADRPRPKCFPRCLQISAG